MEKLSETLASEITKTIAEDWYAGQKNRLIWDVITDKQNTLGFDLSSVRERAHEIAEKEKVDSLVSDKYILDEYAALIGSEDISKSAREAMFIKVANELISLSSLGKLFVVEQQQNISDLIDWELLGND